jgi:hypothetical protein
VRATCGSAGRVLRDKNGFYKTIFVPQTPFIKLRTDLQFTGFVKEPKELEIKRAEQELKKKKTTMPVSETYSLRNAN